MATVVDKLLEIDRRARQTIDEAQQYYDNTLKETERDCEALREEYHHKVEAHLEQVRQIEESAARERTLAIRERFNLIEAELSSAWEENHTVWEQELYERCVGGED